MTKYLRNLVLVIGVVLIPVSGTDAQSLNNEERCAIAKVKATLRHSKCVAKATIKGIKKGLSDDELDAFVEPRVELCEALHSDKFKRAQDRAEARGGTCATVGDAGDVQEATVDFWGDFGPLKDL